MADQASVAVQLLPERPLPERLVVIEQEGSFVVVNDDDPSDWVACFSPDERFPAREWAERMAELYNLRPQEESERDPHHAPTFSGSHHPNAHPNHAPKSTVKP
jgi:hypothetical protein